MIIEELQEGNYLKYNNVVYKVTTLNTTPRCFWKNQDIHNVAR